MPLPRRRRLLSILLLLLLLSVGWFVRSRLDGWVRTQLEQRLAESLDAEVRIGALELDLARLAVDLRDVRVVARGPDAPLERLEFDRGRLRLGLAGLPALAAGWLHLAEVALQGPRCRLRGPLSASDSEDDTLGLSLDIVVDDLSVREGVLAYVDRELPLDFTAAGVELEAAWSRSTLIGNVAFAYEVTTPPLVRALRLQVASGFRWKTGRLDLLRLHAAGDGLEVELDAEIVVSGPGQIHGVGRVGVDLDRLGALLPADAPVLAGNAGGAFRIERGGDLPPARTVLQGHLEAGRANLGGLRVEALEGDARYESGQLELSGLQARAFGGTVEGSATVRIGERLHFDTRLAGSDLEAVRVLDFVDVPLPLGARVEARVHASGDPERTSSWSGGGEFVMHSDPADPNLLPARGRGDVRLEPGRLFLHAEPVHGGSTDLTVDAEIAVGEGPGRRGEVRLAGVVSDAAETQRATLRVLDSLGVVAPEILQEPLFGSGAARARIALGSEQDFDVTLDLESGAFGDRPFDRLQLEAAVLAGRVRIGRLDVTDERQRLSGSAELLLDPLTVSALDLEAERLDTRWITDRLPTGLPLLGRLSGRLKIDRTAAGFAGSGTLNLEEARVLGEPLDAVSAGIELLGDRLRVRDARLHGAAGEAEGEATIHLATGRVEIELARSDIDLAAVEALARIELPLRGRLLAHGSVAFDGGGGGSGRLELAGAGWSIGSHPLGAVEGGATLLPDGFDVRLREPAAGSWEAAAHVVAAGDWPVEGTLEVRDLGLGDATDPDRPVAAVVTGSFDYSGPIAAPSGLRAGGRLERLRLDIGTKSLTATEPIDASFSAGRIAAAPIHLRGLHSDVSANVVYDAAADAWDAALTGTLDAGLVSALVPDLRASGDARVDLRLGGGFERPALAGSISVDQGRLRWSQFPETFEQIELELRIDGDQATADSLRALVGGGELSGTGEVLLDGLSLVAFAATLDAEHVRLGIPEGFAGVYDGRLRIEGDLDHVALSGRANLLRGLYDDPFEFGGLLGFGAAEVTSATGPDAGYPVFLDLDVKADGGVWLRNETAEVETAIDLNLGGTVERPEITGQITALEGGKLVFRDVDYRIESAGLQFVERERLNPYLTLRARTSVRNYEIALRVEGTQDDFRYELTSNPTLSTQDIIALLTTGHTLEDLTASQRDPSRNSYTGDVAANYFAGALTGRFEKQLQRLLGLERVRIDPLLVEGESDPTTRITIGKEVADDVFVIVSQDVGDTERQIYQLEWQASPQIRLTAERNELGSVGGDVQYTDRFRLRKLPPRPPDPRLPPPPGTAADSAGTVAALVIEGVPQDQAAALLKRVPLAVGKPFDRSKLFDGLQALRRAYVREGRIEAQIRTAVHETGDGDAVEVSYLVEPGPKLQVVFEGVDDKHERRLREQLETLWTESLFNEDLAGDSVQLIQRYFQERGYYAVDVSHERVVADGENRLVFTVDRGRPVTVESVRILGAAQVDEDRVRRQMSIREPTFLSRKQLDPEVLDDDVRAIRNLYWDLGYLVVDVKPPRIRLSASSERADVTVEIDEGPQFHIASVTVPEGLPFDAESMRDWSGLNEGEVFSPHRLVEAEGRLRAGIDERGYADARVRARFELKDRQAAVSFEVVPGDLKIVGEVAIEGNIETKRKVIEREVDLKEGDPVSRAGLLRIQHRLYGLGIFRSVRVGYRPLEDDPGRQLLEVHVEEAAPIGLSVGGGYENEGDARVRLSLTHDNLGGSDRAVGLHARASRLVRRVQLTAEDRHLFGSKTPGLVNLGFEEREETAFRVDRRTIALRADRRRGQRWSGFLRYSFQRVDLLDVTDALAAREDKLDNISLGDIGLTILRDTRDDPFLTRSGSLFSAETRVFDDALLSEASFARSIVTGAYMHTFDSGKAVASVVRLGLAEPFGGTGRVPLSERYFAGGDSTLRGFGRDEVGPQEDGLPAGGEAMFLVNQEFRFPLWGSLKAVAFVDVGNVYDTLSDIDLTDLREVAGTGLRLETPIGPIRLEYGWKLDRRPEESRGEWVLAIGMAF